jgi:hypothetical protein
MVFMRAAIPLLREVVFAAADFLVVDFLAVDFFAADFFAVGALDLRLVDFDDFGFALFFAVDLRLLADVFAITKTS